MPELVRKFISKGHNPKELETDGIFPEDLLAYCLMNDMTYILLESDISLGEHCVKALVPSQRNPKILQAFINHGWNNDGYTPLMMINYSKTQTQHTKS